MHHAGERWAPPSFPLASPAPFFQAASPAHSFCNLVLKFLYISAQEGNKAESRKFC